VRLFVYSHVRTVVAKRFSVNVDIAQDGLRSFALNTANRDKVFGVGLDFYVDLPILFVLLERKFRVGVHELHFESGADDHVVAFFGIYSEVDRRVRVAL
jgi:hypothetical protein